MKYMYRLQSCPSQEPTEVDANFSDGSDESEVVTSVGSDIDIEDPAGLQGMEPQNSLRKVILTAVINALKVMDESGSSIKTFEETLTELYMYLFYQLVPFVVNWSLV